MNNSKLAIENVSLSIEETVDRTPQLREREQNLIHILEAVRMVKESESWSTLKKEIFDGLVGTLNKEITEEAKKEDPDRLKLNRLAGQLKWAEKYSDLGKLENVFKLELTKIRQLLYGKG